MEDRAAQDEQIVREVLRGDRNAFARVVARYQRLVAAVAWRYGVRREEIEDVVSEVFFKAYRNLHRYRADHPFSTWLYRLSANHMVDHGRRRRRQVRQVDLPEQLDDVRPGPAERIERDERSTLVRQALDDLKPRYREVMFLVYIEGLPVEETARMLGLPQGTVKSRLLRGRDALRKTLLRRHPECFGS